MSELDYVKNGVSAEIRYVTPTVTTGGIYATDDRKYRVVVYLRNDHGVLYDPLPYKRNGAGNGGCCGPGADNRFREMYPIHESTMRFEGAHKLYRNERRRRWEVERAARALLHTIIPLATVVRPGPVGAAAERLRRLISR